MNQKQDTEEAFQRLIAALEINTTGIYSEEIGQQVNTIEEIYPALNELLTKIKVEKGEI